MSELPPQLREALDIMGRRGKVVELTRPRTPLSREDAAARDLLWSTAELIERRWPGEYSALCRDLRDLRDTISEECQ